MSHGFAASGEPLTFPPQVHVQGEEDEHKDKVKKHKSSWQVAEEWLR